MKVYKVDAVVLKSRDMRDADKILTLYSVQRGKQRVVAHGAAKPSSRKRGAVQPFCYSSLLIHRGKELDSVSQADLREAFPGLREDLERLTAAAYMAELIDGFTGEGEPNQAQFALLLSTLHLLAGGNTELTLRAFEARLMELSGLKPELNYCCACGEPLVSTKIWFSPQQGGLLCRECVRFENRALVFSRGTLEVLKTLYRWELSKLHQLKLPQVLRKELSDLLQAYIEYYLEKKLNSAEFLDRLYKSTPGRGTNIYYKGSKEGPSGDQ